MRREASAHHAFFANFVLKTVVWLCLILAEVMDNFFQVYKGILRECSQELRN